MSFLWGTGPTYRKKGGGRRGEKNRVQSVPLEFEIRRWVREGEVAGTGVACWRSFCLERLSAQEGEERISLKYEGPRGFKEKSKKIGKGQRGSGCGKKRTNAKDQKTWQGRWRPIQGKEKG